jgi:hypothetical protein
MKQPWTLIPAVMTAACLCVASGARAENTEGTAQEFFVSLSGNDQGPGTKDRPFRTIARARDAVRALEDKDRGDIVVSIHGGVYQTPQTIEFGPDDGGTGGHTVTYRAVTGERPVICGGMRISQWTATKDGAWKAPSNGLVFRQLYVNGTRAVRSREPDPGEYHRIVLWDLGKKAVLVPADCMGMWKNLQGAEMIVQMNWAEAVLRIGSVSFTGGKTSAWNLPSYATVTVQEPERGLVFGRDYPPKRDGQPFHLENAREFLDSPGEWFLDTRAKTVYYVPRDGEDMTRSEVVAPGVVTLVRVRGTPEKAVKNLAFEGLTFSHSTWLRPSLKGHLHVQAGQYSVAPTRGNEQYVNRPPAAVSVEYAHTIAFKRNTFRHLGSTGLDLHRGTSGSRIAGNVFDDISGNGILVAVFSDSSRKMHIPYNPSDTRELCVNDTITNNYITHVGKDFPGCCGISCGYARGICIEHNEISNTPYVAIHVGWGWTGEENAMEGNVIRANNVHHAMQVLTSDGVITVLSLQPGTLIEKNHIHDCYKSAWACDAPVVGIYLSFAAGGTSERPLAVRRNVVTAGDYSRMFLQWAGLALFDNNMNALQSGGEGSSGHIAEQAGIQKEYADIKTDAAE